MAESRVERWVPDWPDFFRGRLPFPRIFEEGWPALREEHPLRVEELVDKGDRVIRIELPGIDPERDVDILVDSGALHIRAERREESKSDDRRGVHSEFRYGSYSRTLPLPAGVSEEDIKATYADGILEVRVPVKEEGQPKKVPISRK